MPVKTIRWEGEQILIIDQSRLPLETTPISLES